MELLVMLWADAYGQTRLTTVYGKDGQSREQLPAFLAISRAGLLWWADCPVTRQEPVTYTDVYAPVDATARLEFRCEDGTILTWNLPAPVLDIFYENGVTVNPAAITPLIDQIIADGVSPSGSPVVEFVGGRLWTRPSRS